MNQEEKDNNEKNLEGQFVQQLLDGYFSLRSNEQQEGYMREPKTTRQIKEDLDDMKALSTNEVVQYMQEHGYRVTTDSEGSVAWAIWRKLVAEE